jgi:hypothetical protein
MYNIIYFRDAVDNPLTDTVFYDPLDPAKRIYSATISKKECLNR